MRQTFSLAWKEWRENRALLFIGWFIFLGLPVIGGIENSLFAHNHRFEIQSSDWVQGLGWIFAVLLAVACTCREFYEHLDDFWRSRPISLFRWLSVKFIVGYLVVLVACIVPMLIEIGINRDNIAQLLIPWQLFALALVFSIGFLAGIIFRRPAHAMLFALVAVFVLQILPMFIPTASVLAYDPPHWYDSNTSILALPPLATTLSIAIACSVLFYLSTLLARFDVQITAGLKAIYILFLALAIVTMLLVAGHLGTNLPVLSEVSLGDGERAAPITESNGRIYAKIQPGSNENKQYYRQVLITGDRISLGERLTPLDFMKISGANLSAASQPADENPIRYLLVPAKLPATLPALPPDMYLPPGDMYGSYGPFKLLVFRGTGDPELPLPSVKPLAEIDLGELQNYPYSTYITGATLVAYNETSISTFDISNPLKPVPVSRNLPSHIFESVRQLQWNIGDIDEHSLTLPELPGRTATQRLAVIMSRLVEPYWRGAAFDGQYFVRNTVDRSGRLLAYKLANLTDTLATFTKVGASELSAVERFASQVRLTYGQNEWLRISNGLVFAGSGHNSSTFNPSISVFDLKGDKPMKKIGHFTAPAAYYFLPLPDGRSVVAGEKIYLVGAPKRE